MPNLCCNRCFRLGNTFPLQEWTFTPATASWSLPWRMEAAGAPKLAAFLKTFFIPAGNTISALMFIMFRRVNPADLLSRSRSDTDCMLSNSAWEQVQRLFGPHAFDLISLDNCHQRNRVGLHLPHFTLCATPESCGINVFTHSFPLNHNIYVLPPLILIAPPTEVPLGARFSRRLYYCGPWLEASAFLVVAAVTRCRSRSIGKEERRFHFVVPFSGRSRMYLLNLPVYILLGGQSMEARPSLFRLLLPQWFGCKLLPSLWYFNKT